MNDALKTFEDNALNQVKNSIDFHFNELVTKHEAEINKLPESLFKEVFLPYFCGEKNISDGEDILVKWISIAGSPTKEVQIINDQMEPIFRVPPMMDSSIIDIKNDGDGQPFYNIIMNYELHKNQLPVIGENYLSNTITDRFKTLTKDSSAHANNEQKWNDIFIRYNKIEDKTISSNHDSSKLADDELSYD